MLYTYNTGCPTKLETVNFVIKILFDGRGYSGKIFRTVSYEYWVKCTFIENGVKPRVKEKLIFQ